MAEETLSVDDISAQLGGIPVEAILSGALAVAPKLSEPMPVIPVLCYVVRIPKNVSEVEMQLIEGECDRLRKKRVPIVMLPEGVGLRAVFEPAESGGIRHEIRELRMECARLRAEKEDDKRKILELSQKLLQQQVDMNRAG